MSEKEMTRILNGLVDRLTFWVSHGWIGKMEEPELKSYINAIKRSQDLYNKEKEKNKKIKDILEEKNIPIETLVAEWERLEGIEDDLTSAYLSGVYDERAKWEKKENG